MSYYYDQGYAPTYAHSAPYQPFLQSAIPSQTISHPISQPIQSYVQPQPFLQSQPFYNPQPTVQPPSAPQTPEEKIAALSKLLLATTGAIASKVSREINLIKYKTKSQTVKIPVQSIGIQNGYQQVFVTEQNHTTVVPELEDYPVQVQETRQLPNGQLTNVTVTVYKSRQAYSVVKTFKITGVPEGADATEFSSNDETPLSTQFVDALKKESSAFKTEVENADAVVWGKRT
jgi:hypothetical protein